MRAAVRPALGATAHARVTWDVFGYYLYLPAVFIHHDPSLKDAAPGSMRVMSAYAPSTTPYQVVDGPDGARVIKYSSGMALAYAPWFFLAHGLAETPWASRPMAFQRPTPSPSPSVCCSG